MTEPNAWDKLWEKPERPTQPPSNVTPINGERSARYAAAALLGECDDLANTAQGSRNARLNVAALKMGQLIAAGSLDEHTVTDALTNAALTAGLEPGETAATIRSGFSKGKTEPRVIPDTGYEDAPAVTVIDVPELDQADADAFWKARPFLQDVHDWARARRVSPWAVLGAALARVITATPSHIVLPAIVGSHASLNLFIGLVGPSGSGKGAAESVAAELLDVGHLTTRTAGSGEGIAHSYVKRTRNGLETVNEAVMFTVPEVDALAALGSRQGATLLPELRKAWSGEQLGFAYADPAKNLVVERHKYRLCMVVGIQPGRSGALLDDIDGGTPQRFVWLPSTDPDAPDRPPACPPVRSWCSPSGADLGFGTVAGVTPITVCDQARDVIVAARLANTRGEADALDGHALLCQLKVAAALGLADDRCDVSVDDWALADVVMRKSAATRASCQRVLSDANKRRNTGRALAEADRAAVISDRLEDDAVKRVARSTLRYLTKAKGEWVKHRDLTRALSGKVARQHLEAALERLLEAGQIEVDTSEITVRYKATGGVR